MLWLALIHGANGMRTIVNDYVTHDGTRRVLVWALWLSAAFLILLGTLVVFTFDPCHGRERERASMWETCQRASDLPRDRPTHRPRRKASIT